MDNEYLSGGKCINSERHALTKTDPPFVFECCKCGERFALFSESAVGRMQQLLREHSVDINLVTFETQWAGDEPEPGDRYDDLPDNF